MFAAYITHGEATGWTFADASSSLDLVASRARRHRAMGWLVAIVAIEPWSLRLRMSDCMIENRERFD